MIAALALQCLVSAVFCVLMRHQWPRMPELAKDIAVVVSLTAFVVLTVLVWR